MAMRSPATAMPSAHGRRESPVHARALTTARVMGASFTGALAHAVARARRPIAREDIESIP
jgi:hypothetical protein